MEFLLISDTHAELGVIAVSFVPKYRSALDSPDDGGIEEPCRKLQGIFDRKDF